MVWGERETRIEADMSTSEGRKKPGRRALRSGEVRMFRRHDGARGRAFHAHYIALEARYGPFGGLTREYASSVAVSFVEYRSASEVLAEAQRQRKESKCRHPNQATIARLQNRQGLAWDSYTFLESFIAKPCLLLPDRYHRPVGACWSAEDQSSLET